MRKLCIFLIVAAVVVAGVAAGVLTWWFLRDDPATFETIQLDGNGFGDATQHAAFTRIRNAGDMFWWYYPSEQDGRPLLVWLDGVTGTPPSLACVAMLGPYDEQLNRRNESWVTDYNLLFIDAPLGTGFSTVSGNYLPSNVDETAQHLEYVLESFFSLHEELANIRVFFFGQGYGAQLALTLAIKLQNENAESSLSLNLQGVALGNGIIAPSVALSKLGFYLEELGYIYAPGRSAIEVLAQETASQVDNGNLGAAFDYFLGLEDAINDAGAVAVNPGYIVEKLTNDLAVRDYFGQRHHLSKATKVSARNLDGLMDEVVGPALGIDSDSVYDNSRAAVVQAFRDTYMAPAVDKVEYLLQNTNLKVSIYNGNLDAVSNTPGQLDWINSLQWTGQAEFTGSPRQVLVVDGLVQGYLRESPRLQFYWVNVAGINTPLDSPRAMRRVLGRIAGY